MCQICGKEFETTQYKVDKGWGKYCSNKCSIESRKKEKPKRICQECGIEFETTRSNIKKGWGKYCSHECHNKAQNKKIKRICLICGNEFEVKPSTAKHNAAKYCSPECYHKSQERKVKRICQYCGEEFEVLPYVAKNGAAKFCSVDCFNKSMENKVKRICKACGKEFEVNPYKIKVGGGVYCSRECYWESNSGENNANWTGGERKEYCVKFNKNFKNRVAAFWYENNKNICPECNKPFDDRTPNCHHTYYDKKACCLMSLDGKYFSDLGIKNNEKSFEIIGDPNKFVPLHSECHGKTGGKRNRWFYARKFETIINERFGGKSYYTKEEYKEFLIRCPEWIPPYK